ncbi:SLBB domain-containing protein [Telluribacter sp.]|jgi:protein involved in polysaccharide export with SLBB domain|uniref:SLBB domain-containing protein n=1 Tax=Telluribacter sp. TaxID=1978767 RepID=UPI002E134F83|nr:SLBB domain-containing protein [Telluribacter sp.]
MVVFSLRSLFCRVLFLSFFLAGTTISFAQKINPTQVSGPQLLQYYQQAKASGLTDMEIEQAALARGYTLDDITKMRQALQQAQSSSSQGSGLRRDTVGVVREQTSSSSDRIEIAPSSPSAAKSRIFGASFFSNSSLTFEPNLRLATPSNYILGPDDELIVDIYGNAVDNFRLKVSPEGSVKMLNLPPVYVNGLTIEQATERIVGRLRSAYAGLNRSGTFATITLGNVRSIKVMVTGEVERPGTYTISSLATAFNALYLSGGPTENGSFRQIEVIRNNNAIRKIDLYNFLTKADLGDNISLRDQDIILVHPYQVRVEVTGEVKRPGLFETRPGETFQDLMRYMGGFTTDAYSTSVRLRRSTGKEFRVNALGEQEFSTFEPKNSDRYTIGKILNRYENRVQIGGAVLRPGEYALEEGTTTVKQLIQKAEGLREDAFLHRALIQRKQDNYEPQLLSFALGDLVQGKIPDILLKKEDSVFIKSITDLREDYKVTISGAVNKGGTFAYADSMSVSDLIFLAGGFSEGAIPYRIELARRVKNDTLGLAGLQSVRILTFDVDPSLQKLPGHQVVTMQPYDVVFVRRSPRYEAQKTVYMNGEVMYPGTYAIVDKNERISDLIKRAGGLKPEAYLSGAQFIRNKQLVGVDLKSIFENPNQTANLLLEAGDSLSIPKITETVRIVGQVLNPSVINYDTKFSFKDYIAQAGGYTDKARKSKIFVSYPNGRVDRSRSFFFITSRPRIVPGSVITIPAKEEKEGRETSPAEKAAIISVLGTLILTITRFL